MQEQKRVMAIHDISCFGKCSLTVALPIISACGIETTIIPTAVLSTHTGGFDNYTFNDLTNEINPIANHLSTLPIEFNAIYTGFLGSFEQIDIVSNIIDTISNTDTLILVDPVMADDGKLYSSFDKTFPSKMKNLCKKADIITPNITEATLMTDIPYTNGPYTKDYIELILNKLKLLGPKKIVLTGIFFDEKKLGVATLDCTTNKISYYFCEKINGFYPGTGDIFGSALVGSLMNDFTLEDSTKIATNFVCECIKKTNLAGTDIRFGVNFEQNIPFLLKSLNLF